MKKKAKKKGKKVVSRAERDVDRLYVAVQKYVENRGGKLMVIGGVEVQNWDEGAFKFRVAVRCLGRIPAPSNE